MSSEVFEAVRTLLAVREYQDKGVADEVIRRLTWGEQAAPPHN